MPRLLILALILKISFVALAFSLGNTEGSLAFIFVLHGIILEIQFGKNLMELQFNQNRTMTSIGKQTRYLSGEFLAIQEALKKLAIKE